MIKTRLVGLLSHAKKYIVYTILWQWASICQKEGYSVAELTDIQNELR